MPDAIDFYFDLSSPYAYLASERIEALAAGHGRRVRWRPYLMGAVYRVNGMRPLTDIPLINEYSRFDIERCARQHGIPLQMPAEFPYAAIAGSRAFYWLDDRDPGLARDLAHALLRRYFGAGQPVATAEQVAEVGGTLGLAREELLAALQSQAVKDRLRAETEAAIARGVFGSPYFFIDDQPFFGNDRLEQMDEWLRRGGW